MFFRPTSMSFDPKLLYAPMSDFTMNFDEEWVENNIKIIGANGYYQGICTNWLSDCVAVAIRETNDTGSIENILMIHLIGGIYSESLEAIMGYLAKRPLEGRGFRECFVAFSDQYSSESVDDKKQMIQEILKESEPTAFCFACHIIRDSTMCLALNGYAGTLGEYLDSYFDVLEEKPSFAETPLVTPLLSSEAKSETKEISTVAKRDSKTIRKSSFLANEEKAIETVTILGSMCGFFAQIPYLLFSGYQHKKQKPRENHVQVALTTRKISS